MAGCCTQLHWQIVYDPKQLIIVARITIATKLSQLNLCRRRRERKQCVDSHSSSKVAAMLLLFCLREKRRHMASAVEFFFCRTLKIVDVVTAGEWLAPHKFLRLLSASSPVHWAICCMSLMEKVLHNWTVFVVSVLWWKQSKSSYVDRIIPQRKCIDPFDTTGVSRILKRNPSSQIYYQIYASMSLLLDRDKWANSSVCRLKCTFNGVSNQFWKKLRPRKKTWAWTWDQNDDISKSVEMRVS